jgi:fucose permease
MAIPLGLGAGAVDAGLNGYVAEHYKARHMSWLHCFWGIGALTGPLIMSQLIAGDQSWRSGYLIVAIIQLVLAVVLFFSLPLWSQTSSPPKDEFSNPQAGKRGPRGIFFPLKIHGVKYALITFLFYCGIETTVGLWGSSYLVRDRGLDAAAAAVWVSSYYGSITLGRLIAGFITFKINNKVLIRIGQGLILTGVVLMFLPFSAGYALFSFILIGLGAAPIFPSLLHETPARFGQEDAQHVMGFQMAAAYIGSTFLPPIFGFIASNTNLALFPVFLLAFTAFMLASSERLNAILTQNAAG